MSPPSPTKTVRAHYMSNNHSPRNRDPLASLNYSVNLKKRNNLVFKPKPIKLAPQELTPKILEVNTDGKIPFPNLSETIPKREDEEPFEIGDERLSPIKIKRKKTTSKVQERSRDNAYQLSKFHIES